MISGEENAASSAADDRPKHEPSSPGGASGATATEASGTAEPTPPKRDILTLPGATIAAGVPARSDQPPRHRRRRRHRRKGPPGAQAAVANGALPATATASAEPASADPIAVPAGEAVAAEAASSVPASAPGEQPHRRRRRRRRHGPRPQGTAPGGVGATADAAGAAPANGEGAVEGEAAVTAPQEDRPERGPRRRNRRRREFRPREDGAPREGTAREEGGAARGPRDRNRERQGPRDRDGERERNRGKGGGRDRDRREGGGKGHPGRDRDRGPRKPEPKLYTFESVVDRGFEEVPDPDNEGATKRNTWTIVKRTVADQRAAKTVSAAYVLKREGGEATEFANLAAARAAVNKTIVHPEKLTRPKADYGSTKK